MPPIHHIQIEPADASQLIDLRHDVLRTNLPREAAYFEGDNAPDTQHFAAFHQDHQTIIGCVTLLNRPFTLFPETDITEDFQADYAELLPILQTQAHQLRGMAVHPDYRNHGVGALLLNHVHDQCARQNQYLWCNARERAMPFYLRHDWIRISNIFDIPTAGAHYQLCKPPAP